MTLLALAGTACAASGSTAKTAASTASTSASGGSSTSPASTGAGTGTATPDSTSTTSSSTSTAAGAATGSAAGGGCSPAQLTVHEVSQQAATGHAQLVVGFTNSGAAPCTLTGYPGLALVSAQGQQLPTTVHRGASYTFPQAPVTTVTLSPGGNASFDVGYEEIPQSNTDTCEQAAGLAIIPPNASAALHLTVSVDACNHGQLDVSPVVSGSHGVD